MDLVTKFLTYRAWFSSPLGGLYGYILVSVSVGQRHLEFSVEGSYWLKKNVE